MGQFDDVMSRIGTELNEMKKRLRPRREELRHTFNYESQPQTEKRDQRNREERVQDLRETPQGRT